MKSILIVDDALFQRHLVKEILQDQGLELREAASGEEALEKLKVSEVDLVLLDITLPGKNGLETLEEIRRTHPFVKVIMVTAQAQKGIMLQAVKLGAEDYLIKPIKPDRLIQTVRKVLELKEN
ncbi:MAG: response regulator [Firmicutes bacterium]|nr:response regulator [Bacillota bacterium]